MDIKLSVIIPVYNAGKYLNSCIDHLQKQTLKDIEFLFIIDKPTDGSDKVVKDFALNDSRFVVIENEQNLHIGKCRNKGIELARGKYIAFCDHDDYMDPSMYADLITIAEKSDADIVVSPSIIEYENMRKKGQKIEYFNISSDRLYFLERLVGKKNYDAPGQEYLWGNGNMWNKIFKKEIINKNNIRFVDTKYCCYEDILFQYRCFFNSENISTTSIPYYHHILFGNNTSLSSNYASSVNTLNFLRYLYSLLKEESIDDSYNKRFKSTLIKYINYSTISILHKNLSLRDFFRTLDMIKEDNEIKKLFLSTDLSDILKTKSKIRYLRNIIFYYILRFLLS